MRKSTTTNLWLLGEVLFGEAEAVTIILCYIPGSKVCEKWSLVVSKLMDKKKASYEAQANEFKRIEDGGCSDQSHAFKDLEDGIEFFQVIEQNIRLYRDVHIYLCI